jgi:hypothetical protein
MLLPLVQFFLTLVPCGVVYLYIIERKKLREEYQQKLKELENRTKCDPEFIEDIFSDFKTRGFTFLRIDPTDIFYRTPRD